ncbi:MAG: hypothetical protein FJ077_10645 [Cyanobacteria bacterium K_DeepCast_35m_m2_023]|nr:hypothetical protein [Cyanobacteria bacterium K_DeepCast_35m_m2_023]
MAASRLTDSQKRELIDRFREGASPAALAADYGCSPNTVSRAAKAVLGEAEYERLKRQRSRGGIQLRAQAATAVTTETPPTAEAAAPAPAAVDSEPLPSLTPASRGNDAAPVTASVPKLAADSPVDDASLAIDDADDFGDVDGETDDDGIDDGLDAFDADVDAFTPIAVLPLGVSQEPVEVKELQPLLLPESLYMLVDKTVELQARPLRDFTELGVLPPEEEDQQALQLFANPRQAKRHCGRTQRVIKMPDPEVLLRRASYLHRMGISRLVVEGTLYALP